MYRKQSAQLDSFAILIFPHVPEEMGRQHQGMDRPGVHQVPEGSGEQRQLRKLVVKSSMVPQRPSHLTHI